MSTRVSGFTRVPADLYQTPAWVVSALTDVVALRGPIFEPACGEGQIAAALEAVGLDVVTSDLNDYQSVFPAQGHIRDFLECRGAHGCQTIVTNPPYGQQGRLAAAFVEHALELMRPVRGAVWMLLPTDFDHAVTRRHLFADCRQFSRRIVLHRRIKWFDHPQISSTPSANHSWFGWDFQHVGAPVVSYSGLPERRRPKAGSNVEVAA